MTAKIKPLIAGNWKMNGLGGQIDELALMAKGYDDAMASRLDMLVCVPNTLLERASRSAGRIAVGGQDCHGAISGANTGDVSAEMLGDSGASAVIVGHSERRIDHGETSAIVKTKAEAALRAGLMPVICIGETKAQRLAGETLAVLGQQLAGSLPGSVAIAIAYEPVWAIGTGLTPTLDDVAKAHGFIRGHLERKFGKPGGQIRLLYGGSVKPSNAATLLGVANVNGALVGGASLKAVDFLAICAACP